jgi:glutamyl-tRNA synthetase
MLRPDDFAARIVPYLAAEGVLTVPLSDADESLLSKAAPLIQERLQLLGDAPNLLRFLFTDEIFYTEDALAGLPDNSGVVLAASVGALELVPEAEFTAAAVQEALAAALIEGLALKPRVAYGPLRVAVSGRRISPPLFESMELLGKAESIRRLVALGAFRSE